jgi:L-malate glycosyltransferase
VIVSSQRDLGHLELYRTGRRRWLRRLQKLSTSVLTNANAVRESLLDETHFPATKVRLVHNGVDVSRFICESRDRSWIAQNAGHERWVVLVGSMHSVVKGHRSLIEAAPQVVSEFPEVRFVLVGDGALRKGFESLIAKVGLKRHFLFLGERNDVPKILCCSDIAVLPSSSEGLSNALLEYLAAGLPAVAARVGGNAEIVQDGKTGLLIPPEDTSSLAAALLRLLHDPGLGQELGRNGKEFVASNFSFDRMVSETDRFYTELLQSRGVE